MSQDDIAVLLREPTLSTPIEQTAAVFDKWLYLPDRSALYAMLGTVAANLLPGDPVWLMLVGPPGGGKSELLQSLSGLEFVRSAATLTEAALLSGSSAKDRAKDASGGLLREIGAFGVLLAKDFGSVLSMNTETRGQLLAALREVYDGSWHRLVGTDGGKTLSWTGKLGFVGGCTQSIDRHHAVIGAMGERFVYLRLPQPDAAEQARRALSHGGRETEMRAELSAAVGRLFTGGQTPARPRGSSPADVERLIALATFTVRARSAVERDGRTRDIELIPDAESPTRLVLVLQRLLGGFDAIGLDRDTAWPILTRVSFDSIPALRLNLMTVLDGVGTASTTEAATHAGYPTQTVRRGLEDLAAHGVVYRRPQGAGKADHWSLSDWTQERLAEIGGFPEMPGRPQTTTLPEKPEATNGLSKTKDGNSGTPLTLTYENAA